MEVHIFHPKESFKDETFCNFIQNHYKIPVVVHQYDRQSGSSHIVDFLRDNEADILLGSIISSLDVSVNLDSSVNYEVNKTVLKKKEGYLGGMVITQGDTFHPITPGAILNLYKGMLEFPATAR